MNRYQADVDPDAHTSPPASEMESPLVTWSRHRANQHRQFVLVAVAVPLVALMIGIAAGALAAVAF